MSPLGSALSAINAAQTKSIGAYDELKDLVRANDQQSAVLLQKDKAAAAALAASRRETVEAKAEAEALKSECKRLQGVVAGLRDKRVKEKKAAAAATEEMHEHLEEAVRREGAREAARSAAEVALLRRAAAEDVRSAKAAADAHYGEQADAMREMMKLRSAKHALRLREVILSEEVCQAECERLRGRLREASYGLLALSARASLAERRFTIAHTSACSLVEEVATLEDELANAVEDHLEEEAHSADAVSAAEHEVELLRSQVQEVASKQKSFRKHLQQRHASDVRKCVEVEVARVQEAAWANAEQREAEHQAEVEAVLQERDALARELSASRAREEAHRAEAEALAELLG